MDNILRDIKASGITNVLPKNEKGNPDLSPLGSQAQEIWKLLDRMSTEDPAAYERFVTEQVQHLQKEGQSSTTTGNQGSSSSNSKDIIPDIGFCIYTKILDKKPYDRSIIRPKFLQRDELPREIGSNQGLFINVCTHSKVNSPKDAHGKDIMELELTSKHILTTQELLNIEIPLAIGDIRRLSKEYYQRTCWAVDIILHPWIVNTASRRDTIFRDNLIIFLSDCVSEELSLVVNSKDSKCESLPYIGGSTVRKNESSSSSTPSSPSSLTTPLPFNPQRLQIRTEEDNKLANELLNKLGKNRNTNSTSTKKNSKSSTDTNNRKNTVLSSPSSLLRAVETNHELSSSSSSSSSSLLGNNNDSTSLPELDGLRIKGLENILNSSLNDDNNSTLPGNTTNTKGSHGGIHKEVSQFAEFAASLFPQQQLVHNGACRYELDISNSTSSEDNVSSSVGNNVAIVRISFDAAYIHLPQLSMKDLELDVTNTSITIRINRQLLLQYTGLELPMIPILIQSLPITVNADEVRAKYSKKLHQLTITLPVL